MFAVIFILRAETFYRAAREATFLHTQRQTLSIFWIIGVGDVRVVSREFTAIPRQFCVGRCRSHRGQPNSTEGA